MKLLGERNKIDVALLPIGDNFTMGPEDAVPAAEFLKADRSCRCISTPLGTSCRILSNSLPPWSERDPRPGDEGGEALEV